jgi:myo-inositol-1(or 4)-monophosphatase
LPEADKRNLPDPQEDLTLLLEAAREAGEIAMGYFGKDPQVWIKEGSSPVSEAYYAADRYLRETLLNARPGYGWLSEETADDLKRLDAPRTFVVDPIDGTRAFIAGNPTWCVSIAVVEEGRSLAGVLDCPAKGEIFSATTSGGAFLDGKRIAVRTAGSSPEIAGPKDMIDELPKDLIARASKVGYVPSLAYRIAMIAAGRIDASFVKPDSHDWDLAAAALILEEAGGKLIAEDGLPPRFADEMIRHGALVAGSNELLDELYAVIAKPEGRAPHFPV